MRGMNPFHTCSVRWKYLPRRAWNCCALSLALLAMMSATPSLARVIDCLDGASIESPDAGEGESESPVEDSSGDGDAVGVVTFRSRFRSARQPQRPLQFADSEETATGIRVDAPSPPAGRFASRRGCFRLRC